MWIFCLLRLVFYETRVEAGKVVIETCQELGVSKEDTLVRLVEKMELTREKAIEYLTEYWNEN